MAAYKPCHAISHSTQFLVREGADGREVAGVDWEFNAWGGLYGDYSKDVKIASAILEVTRRVDGRVS